MFAIENLRKYTVGSAEPYCSTVPYRWERYLPGRYCTMGPNPYQEGVDGLCMGLVILLLDGCLLEGVLNVEGRGIEPAPVPVLGRLHGPVVGVHVRAPHQGPVLQVGLDGQCLRVELGLSAGPATTHNRFLCSS